jgi:hypothetical protein
MPFSEWSCNLRRALFSLLAASLCTALACAQSSTSQFQLNQSNPGYSSSATNLVDDTNGATTLKAAIADGNTSGGGGRHNGYDWKTHFSFDAGGGFNAPIGNDQPFITWGGNVSFGAGFHLSKRISLLGEYQFIDDKLPGAFITAAGDGATNGNAHIWSITLNPIVDLFPKSTNSMYLTGGGGFYHKTTSFNVQVCCDFYGYPVSENTNGFSSRQGGLNLGLGYSHRVGGMYHDGTMKLFAEARYLFVDTPRLNAATGPTPIGTTELIPVTIGLRW